MDQCVAQKQRIGLLERKRTLLGTNVHVVVI